jgi:uncharacterized protein
MRRRGLAALAVAVAAPLVVAVAAIAEPSFPALSGRVVDQAGILDAAVRSRLDGKLEQLESKTTTQLVVATLPSLQGYDIADYGYRLGRHWGIGQKGSNNGALLIVAPNERKVRIEVGYGLEGTLTDAISRLIIENAILPRFRAGDFPGGIERGVDDLVQVLSGDADDFKRRAAEQRDRPRGGEGLGWFAIVVLILLLWLAFSMRGSGRQRLARRGGWWLPAGGAWSTGSRGGWSGGGGVSGGGFSGGGGSFGGGGSSGSW